MRRTGKWVTKGWWEQEGLDLEGAWAACEAADEGDTEEAEVEAEVEGG